VPYDLVLIDVECDVRVQSAQDLRFADPIHPLARVNRLFLIGFLNKGLGRNVRFSRLHRVRFTVRSRSRYTRYTFLWFTTSSS
jgi:hypothetical protein